MKLIENVKSFFFNRVRQSMEELTVQAKLAIPLLI